MIAYISLWVMIIIICIFAGTVSLIFVNVLTWLSTKLCIMVWVTVHRFQQLEMQWKILTFLTAVGALVVPVLVTVYGIRSTSDEQLFVSEITTFFSLYVLELHLLYGSMIVLFIIAVCVFAKKKLSGKEQQVDYEATQRDLHQRLSIATQVYNFQQREIYELRRNVAILTCNLQESINLNAKTLGKQPMKMNLVKPPCLCYMCMSMNNVITEESELQTQHTELMRRYHKLDNKYNELAKRLRDEQASPPPLPKQYKLRLKGDDALCVVCMEKKRQFILKPCNHYCVCNDCKNSLKNKCPVCRTHIRKYEKLFVS